ncbi:MAG: hypothetical protein ACREXR_00700 [Gammaproteobacteria bacterium]
MKNILLFIFGTLMVLFGATTVMLYMKYDGSLLSNLASSTTSAPSPLVTKKNFTGQIFIVTRGGSSVPLGGVVVSFYTQKQFNSLLPAIFRTIGAEVGALMPLLKEKQKAEREAYNAYANLSDKVSLDKSIKVGKIWDKKEREREEVYYALLFKTNAEVYANALPKPYVTAQTDPNGKFNLSFSTDNPLVATACASRHLGEKTENYCWFVTMDGSKEVFFNNHNMFGMYSSDAAIRMPELPMDCTMTQCANAVSALEDAYSPFFTAATP